MAYEFKRTDVLDFGKYLGIKTHIKGDEMFFEYCPKCHGGRHDKNTFSINLENGTFNCFRSSCGYKETPWQGIMIKPGQCVIGTERLAKELDFTRAQIRYALNKLKSTNEITIKTTNKYSIVTLVNWEDYQLINIDNSQQNHQQTNQQIANKKPTKSQQIATSEEIKNKRIKEYTRARARRNGF